MMKNRMLLVVGRTASGKDTFVKQLEGVGFKPVLSYTTRPSRGPEDRHIFITEEEAARYTERAAETVINGYQYFITYDQLEDCNVYVIDPKGVYELLGKYPDMLFDIIYVLADDDIRKSRYVSRQATEEVEEEFEKRNSSEDAQFLDFEEWIWNVDPDKCSNISTRFLIDNNGSADDLESNLEWLLPYLR